MSKKLCFTPEIGSSYLSQSVISSEYENFIKNPSDFLKSELNLDLPHTEFKAVQNDDGIVNLTLPYYSNLAVSSSTPLSDSDMNEVVGGEVIVSIIVCATVISSTVGVGLVAAATFGSIEMDRQAGHEYAKRYARK